ncbi:MAG: hypothetical protein R2716_09585 [Microthrixaceae bacterium]
MPQERYSVECDLGLGAFDDLAEGVRAARSAFGELARPRRLDDRLRSARMRRRTPTVVEISICLHAGSLEEAFALGIGALRCDTRLGGSTVGWESLRPMVAAARHRRRWWTRRRHREEGRAQLPAARFPTWSELAAEAARRRAAAPTLPPLELAGSRPVVDLRT